MDLYNDMLTKLLSTNPSVTPTTLIENTCYQAIQEIRKTLDNDKLNDFKCIEKIVLLLESIGTNGGSRHDFS